MIRVLVVAAVVLAILVPDAHAQIFLELEGANQGRITGSSSYPGEEGNIEIQSYSFGMISNYQPGAGLGSVDASSVNISKAYDAASINLAAAVGEWERLTTCRIRIYTAAPFATSDEPAALERRMPMGYEMEIELVNARVESFSSAGAPSDVSESISLVFEEIRISYGPVPETFVWSRVSPARRVGSALPTDALVPWTPKSPLTFDVPSTGSARVDVTDADGRLVRTLFLDAASSDDGTLAWDATDASGQRVAPGIYTATRREDGRETTRRIVIGD